MSSLRNSIHRRNHKERSQPYERARFGLLEKHKDYVLRARDYHSKEKRIKVLREKALGRNEDEFYFGMTSSSTKNGVHVKDRGEKSIDIATARILKSQDVNYIKTQSGINLHKIERLRSQLEGQVSEPNVDKIIFVNDDEEVKKFQERNFNEVQDDDEEEEEEELVSETKEKSQEESSIDKDMRRKRAELAARLRREEQLQKVEKEINSQRVLMGKGRKRKIGVDKDGLPIYKWKLERKS